MTLARRVAACTRGGTAVEFALILPLLLLFLLGAMEYARLAWVQSTLTYAVQDASRCSAVRPDVCGDAAKITAYVQARTGLLLPAPGEPTLPIAVTVVADPTCGARITAEASPQWILWPIFGARRTITAAACRSRVA
ncbi:TadE/TadG family type IV pilus assembly protein [Phenylobacterium sp.]|uniref:TadE/TadG family type IV pilus assembly protein n=1 Tax=Phenylobacterium sp. TaxID=1871053 RepID=UPI0035B3B2EC